MREAELPDGTILEFPDETPDAVMDMTVKKHLSVPVDVSRETKPEETGFMQRVGEGIKGRVSAIETAKDLPNFLISSARLGVGTPIDVAAEAAKSGFQALPEKLQKGIKTGASNIVGRVAKIPLTDAKNSLTLGEIGSQIGIEAEQFAKEHPTIANALGYAMEVPAGAMATKAASALGKTGGVMATKAPSALGKTGVKVISTTGKAVKKSNLATGLAPRGSQELENISTAMRAESSATFKKAFDAGVIIKPDKAARRLADFDTEVGRLSVRRRRSRWYYS